MAIQLAPSPPCRTHQVVPGRYADRTYCVPNSDLSESWIGIPVKSFVPTPSKKSVAIARPRQAEMRATSIEGQLGSPYGSPLGRQGRSPGLQLLERPRRTCWPSTASRPHTGRSCARPTTLERVNKEIARRSDIVGIFPNDHSVIRLVGSLLDHQRDEWLLTRGYLSKESIALDLEDQGDGAGSGVAALER